MKDAKKKIMYDVQASLITALGGAEKADLGLVNDLWNVVEESIEKGLRVQAKEHLKDIESFATGDYPEWDARILLFEFKELEKKWCEK